MSFEQRAKFVALRDHLIHVIPMPKKRALLFLFFFFAILSWLMLARENRAPFGEIEFLEDYPGAGSRNVQFTPVLRSDHSRVVGEVVYADYGVLHYRDCDGDGINEAVVETEPGMYALERRESVRHVYKYAPDESGRPKVKLISSELLPEKDPEELKHGPADGAHLKRFCE